jgi:TctA family transporter
LIVGTTLLILIAVVVAKRFGVLEGVAVAGAVWLLMPFEYRS